MTPVPPDARPVVAVWRSSWLPRSETFIRNQVASLRRWQPFLVGLRRVDDSLDIVPDYAPYGPGLLSRVKRKVNARMGYRWGYDAVLRRHGVRVIHAHFGPAGTKVLPIARRTGIPLVVTFHGFDVTSEPARDDAAGAAYRADLRTLFAHAARLVAVSRFVAGRLVELGAPASKVVVRHIGIPVDGMLPERADRSGVAFIGRLVDGKGVADLIEAFALLPDDLRAATPLRIAGFGPLAEPLEQLARERGVPAEFLGRLTSEGVADLLAGSAVFAAPSHRSADGWSEAFGIVFLEAALQGLPVVSYRHGGVPEAVQEGVTALLADERDVAGLAAHLRRLLENPDEARALGEAGRRRVLAEFDVVSCTAALEDLYDEVVTTR